MGIDKDKVDPSRRSQSHDTNEGQESSEGNTSQPPYLFKSGDTLLAMTKKYNVGVSTLGLVYGLIFSCQMTIAQLVYDNERHYYTEEQIHTKVAFMFSAIAIRGLLSRFVVDENLASHG